MITNCRSAGPLLKTCEADTGRFSIELNSINHPVAVSTFDFKKLGVGQAIQSPLEIPLGLALGQLKVDVLRFAH